MERTKDIKTNKAKGGNGQVDIKTFSELVSRASFAAKLGQQYGTDRDIYEALGYKTNITYRDYATRYLRQDIAKAIIDRPVQVTWRGQLDVVEADQEEETALERQWKQLKKDLQLKQVFTRLDKLTGIGEYGVLLLGLNDTKKREDYQMPVTPGKRKLKFVKPFGQEDAEITAWENRTSNERYGQPLQYTITVQDSDGGDSILKVHYTRIIHVVDGMLESEVRGTPRLESVYNRLMDLEKLVGGSAEMFWRGARPGYKGKLDPDYQMTEDTHNDLQDQINEYEHNLRRILVNEGIDLKALQQQVSDPSNHVDIQLQMISAVTGIPKRILTGSERGELASSQDKTEWLAYVKSRREEYAEPNIVRPFVDVCMQYGVLTAVDKYDITWEDLFAQSDKDKAEVGKIRATALKEYAANPGAETVVPQEAFAKFFLGLTDDQIELIGEMRDAAIKEEQEEIEEQAALEQEPPEESEEE